jgi:hypothetical protein
MGGLCWQWLWGHLLGTWLSDVGAALRSLLLVIRIQEKGVGNEQARCIRVGSCGVLFI